MAIKNGLQILVVWACLFSIGLADPTWFAFWAKQPKNADSTKKVWDLLLKDAAKVNDKPAVKPILVNHLDDGQTVALWYWWAKIEKSRTEEQDYKDLLQNDLAEIIDIVDLINRENPSYGKPGLPSDEDILKPYPVIEDPAKRMVSPQVSSPQKWKGRMKRGPYTKQPNAPRQLRFISLPEDKNNDLDGNTDYVYDENAGKGAHVYVVDSGLNFDSSEWGSDGGRPKPDILYGGFGSKYEAKDIDEAKNGHGTCMADLAVGKINGVAKEALLTAVQFDEDTFKANVVTGQEAVVEAMSRVVDDVYERRQDPRTKDEKIVISLSISLEDRKGVDGKAFIKAFYETLKELDDHGAGLVVSMPNDDICAEVPCGYGLESEGVGFLKNIVLVGNGRIDNGGYSDPLEDINDPDEFTVFGPGDDQEDGVGEGVPGIICASKEGDKNRENLKEEGTSHATAFTAGLMAYHMGNGKDRDGARKLIVDTAYARMKDGPKMIFNAAV